MTVLIIYGIDNKVRVYMPLVYMRGYQNFMPFPCLCMLCQLDSVLVSLLRGYFLVLMVGLHIMLSSGFYCGYSVENQNDKLEVIDFFVRCI